MKDETVKQKKFLRLLQAAYDLKTFYEDTPSYKQALEVVNDFYTDYGPYINNQGWISPREFYSMHLLNLDSNSEILIKNERGIKRVNVHLIPAARFLDNTYTAVKILICNE